MPSCRSLEKAFGSLPAGEPPPPVRAVEPEQHGERRVEFEREAELPFVGISYHAPNIRHADGPALQVLSTVLAGGKSARLYSDMVYKKRLAREVGAWYDDTSVDPGLFSVYAQPMPKKNASEAEAELLAQVEALKKEAVRPRELEKAKNGIEAEFTLAQDSYFYQGMLLAQYEILGDWRWIDRYLPAIQAVTAGDLKRVASTYLTRENRTIGVLVPLVHSGPGPVHRAPPVAAGPVH